MRSRRFPIIGSCRPWPVAAGRNGTRARAHAISGFTPISSTLQDDWTVVTAVIGLTVRALRTYGRNYEGMGQANSDCGRQGCGMPAVNQAPGSVLRGPLALLVILSSSATNGFGDYDVKVRSSVKPICEHCKVDPTEGCRAHHLFAEPQA